MTKHVWCQFMPFLNVILNSDVCRKIAGVTINQQLSAKYRVHTDKYGLYIASAKLNYVQSK